MADHAAPTQPTHELAIEVIDRVLGSFISRGVLRRDELDDIRSLVMLRVLRRFEGDTNAEGVRSFDDYVAKMAINAVNDCCRARRSAPATLPDFEGIDPTDHYPEPHEAFATRQMLVLLWDEIRQLPLLQRRALLLHVRDHNSGSAIPLLIFTGVATLDEIAAVLEYTRTTVERLWDRLPMADLDIAEILALTRQQVIGLRRSARERLERARRRLLKPIAHRTRAE